MRDNVRNSPFSEILFYQLDLTHSPQPITSSSTATKVTAIAIAIATASSDSFYNSMSTYSYSFWRYFYYETPLRRLDSDLTLLPILIIIAVCVKLFVVVHSIGVVRTDCILLK
mmetsp:Transcript_28361/g.31833  ORF Transcript_28361/g.31833 Transcript_28361/m.31833 type:complete len:113 (+) Transcript_28361:152-490(+)